MDQDALSETQRQALAQLQALTNGGDVDVAMSVLESVGWDVERAADVVFGSSTSAPLSINRPPAAPAPSTREEPLEIDDSEQSGLLSGRPSGREFARVAPSTNLLSYLMRPLRLIIALLAVPYTILRVVLRTLRVPLPLPPVPLAFSLAGLGLGLASTPARAGSAPVRDGRTAAERWVRALEEETGCVARAHAQAAASGAEPGSSSSAAGGAQRRAGAPDEGARALPDFFVGSYETFARALAREGEARVGCVVLVSEEHDDVAEFKRSTLTDPEFVQLLEKHEMLIWGGDIRYRDAWSAAQKLQATTYPFVAFLALQPRRGASSASSPSPKTVLTVLSRHQGPAIPAPTAPTSAPTLAAHITAHLLPRVAPVLARIRQDAASRDAAAAVAAQTRARERALREEQDRAFAESAARDKARIEARIAAEQAERARALEEERALAAAAKAEAEQARWEAERMAWRRWARRALVPREPRPGEAGRGRTVRVGVRMPDGARAVRFFGEGDALSGVFAFVDALFVPKDLSPSTDPVSPPGSAGDGAQEDAEAALAREIARSGRGAAWWGFRLATVYPRREVAWAPGRTVGAEDALRSGGQLVVELEEEAGRRGKGRRSLDVMRAKEGEGEGEEDGYETESD